MSARAAAFALLLLTAAALGGCGVPFVSTGSELTVRSQTHPGRFLAGDFDRAIYRLDDKQAVTVVLLSGPDDAPRQAAVVRMFWKPRAGATPISATATNATVQYLVFPEGGREVGVYSGAGFVHPSSGLGGDTFRGGLWQANLRLTDRSTGFEDLLGQAMLRGDLAARRDDAAVGDLLRQLHRRVTDRLGYPRLVAAPPPCHGAKAHADRRGASSS